MSTSLQRLRETHRSLTESVDDAERAFEPASSAAFSQARCPEYPELEGVLRATHRAFSLLADFIDGVLVAFTKTPEAAAELLREVEPVRTGPRVVQATPSSFLEVDDAAPRELKDAHWAAIQAIHPCQAKGESAIGRMPGIYGISTGIDNHLFRQGIIKSHLWRETHALWLEFTYHGGITASGGLANRLQTLRETCRQRTSQSPGPASVLERVKGLFGAKVQARQQGGDERIDTDTRKLRALAATALWLANASPERLLADAIEKFCEIMDGWLGALEQSQVDAAAEPILLGLVDEAPSPASEAVASRLLRLRQRFDSEKLRARIDARMAAAGPKSRVAGDLILGAREHQKR
jgi:hypothetical protein